MKKKRLQRGYRATLRLDGVEYHLAGVHETIRAAMSQAQLAEHLCRDHLKKYLNGTTVLKTKGPKR